MKCKKCGQINEEGAMFCENCGEPLQPEQQPKPKSKAWIWILVFVLLAGVLGAGGYFYFYSKPHEESESESESEKVAVEKKEEPAVEEWKTKLEEAQKEKDPNIADTKYHELLEQYKDQDVQQEIKESQQFNLYELYYVKEDWKSLFASIQNQPSVVFVDDKKVDFDYSGNAYTFKDKQFYHGSLEDGDFHGDGHLIIEGDLLYNIIQGTFEHNVLNGHVTKVGLRKEGADYQMDQKLDGTAVDGFWDGRLDIYFMNTPEKGGYIQVDYGKIIPVDSFELNGETCYHHIHGNNNWYVTELNDYRVIGGPVTID